MVAGTGTENSVGFSAAETLILPALHELPGIARVQQAQTGHRTEVRYDTADRTLGRYGLSLTRITDDGGFRWERSRLPFEPRDSVRYAAAAEDSADVPPELVGDLQALLRGRPLEAVESAVVSSLTYELLDSANRVAGRVTDEIRTARDTDAEVGPGRPAKDGELSRGARRWFAAADEPDLLDRIGKLLLGAGAFPAATREPMQPPVPDMDADSPVGELLQRYLRSQFTELLQHEPRVRHGDPDGVHKMRVATRRLRSALASYRSALEPEPARSLRAELRWLAAVLGQARDAQVLRHRLRDLVADEPEDLVMGPVAARLDEELLSDYRNAYQQILGALASQRYFSALERLETLIEQPGWTGTAKDPAGPAAARMIRRDRKRLHRRVRQARQLTGEAYAEALHDARKDAKRLRYAAEVWAPVRPEDAGVMVDAAEHLQKVLGEYQDSVVARAYLRRMGASASAAGENGFSYGRLHALEQARADAARERFIQAWKGFPSSP